MSHLIEAAAGLKLSKTVWFNTVVAGLAMLELNFSLLQPLFGSRWYGVAFVAICAVNVALRFVREHAVVTQAHLGE